MTKKPEVMENPEVQPEPQAPRDVANKVTAPTEPAHAGSAKLISERVRLELQMSRADFVANLVSFNFLGPDEPEVQDRSFEDEGEQTSNTEHQQLLEQLRNQLAQVATEERGEREREREREREKRGGERGRRGGRGGGGGGGGKKREGGGEGGSKRTGNALHALCMP